MKKLQLSLIAIICAASSLPSYSEEKTYIVRVKQSEDCRSGLCKLTRAPSLSWVAQELALNVRGVSAVRSLRKLGLVVVKSSDQRLLESALNNNPHVQSYEEDHLWTIAQSLPTETPSGLTKAPWLKDVLGLDTPEPDPTLETTSDPDDDVLVAILDTGANIDHPYLEKALSLNTHEIAGNGKDDDLNGIIDDMYCANVITGNGDCSDGVGGHGSHVAGLVKSVRDQANETYGYQARKVKILPVKFIVGSGGTTSAAVSAPEYAAARKAKVINCSWGSGGASMFSQSLYDAMKELYVNDDIVFAVAAGNAEPGRSPNDNDVIPYFPSGFTIPSLISVASVTPEYEDDGSTAGVFKRVSLSPFSNYGAHTVHIGAPGGYIDSAGSSSGVYSVNASWTSSFDAFVRKNGTSMATPVISGILGVMRSLNPSLTAYEVKQILLDTGTSDDKMKLISSSKIARADEAFIAASEATTSNLKPSVPADPYLVYSASSNSSASSSAEKDSGGGCGAILPMAGNVPPSSGPWGGNSLVLFSVAYAAIVFARSMRRRMRSPSV